MHKGHLKPLWCYIKATRSETQNLFSKIYVYSTEFAVSEKSICQRVRCILLSPHTMYHGVKSLTTKVNIGFRKKKKKYQDSDTTTRLWLIKSRRPCLHLGARQNGLFKAELLTAKKLPETAQWQNTQNGHTHAHTHTHTHARTYTHTSSPSTLKVAVRHLKWDILAKVIVSLKHSVKGIVRFLLKWFFVIETLS